MTVFIEYVLLDNFIIDYLLLKVALKLVGVETKRWRLFFCAFLGSVIALVFPLINFKPIFTVPLKILSGTLIVMLSAKFKGVKQAYKTLVCFLVLTFITGGGIIAIFTAFGIDYSSEISIALIFIPAFLLIKLANSVIFALAKKQENKGLIFKCLIGLTNDKKIEGIGFLDTGNTLYYKGKPVIVCKKSFAKKVFDYCLPKISTMQYFTAIGSESMKIIEVSGVEIYYKQGWHKLYGVVLGVANNLKGDYDFLLHPDLIREVGENEFDNGLEKVS